MGFWMFDGRVPPCKGTGLILERGRLGSFCNACFWYFTFYHLISCDVWFLTGSLCGVSIFCCCFLFIYLYLFFWFLLCSSSCVFLHIVDVGSFLSLGSWSRGFSVGVSLLFFWVVVSLCLFSRAGPFVLLLFFSLSSFSYVVVSVFPSSYDEWLLWFLFLCRSFWCFSWQKVWVCLSCTCFSFVCYFVSLFVVLWCCFVFQIVFCFNLLCLWCMRWLSFPRCTDLCVHTAYLLWSTRG